MTQILDQTADTVLYNARVITMDPALPRATAIAVRDGRFVGVGDEAGLRPLVGPRTERLNLGGRAVVPGLIDTHNHLSSTGLGMLHVSLEGVRRIGDIVGRIAERVRATPPGEWIVTAQVGEPAISHLLAERRYPTRADLDPVSPDHPVCIQAPHVLIVNSAALRRVGVDRGTPDPPGGQLGRDERGELTGLFYEPPAMALVRQYLPPVTHADRVAGLRLACQAYNRVGLTSVCEHGASLAAVAAYQDLWARGELTVRSYVHVALDPTQSLAELDAFMAHLAFTGGPGFGDDWLRVAGLKLFIDGGVGIGTALMREPYRTASGECSHGVQIIPTDRLLEILRLANKHRLRVAQHDSGGRAIDLVLDCYARVDAEVPIADRRFVLVHCQFPSEANIAAIKRLGAVVVTQTVFLYSMGVGYVKYLGRELADQAIPLRRWLDAGVPVALGSDAPVNPYEPLLGLWHAVTRQDKQTGEVIGPDQRITAAEALQGYTVNGAYITFDERRKGVIAPGRLADLVVLGDDPLTCPTEAIRNLPVELTMVGGRIVHAAPGLGG
ncbi:MAG: amidohydrolase [Chloroflexi bacterium]|nr:amidohydrolase [Chloroflexota bacterium]